ncbi:MAG: oligosaccharyl transferase, archaeosortase A system-associated, partial [Dehalococcoidales bacterium]
MSRNKPRPELIAGILLAVFIGVALYFRVALPYDQVFVSDTVKFNANDAYYYLRQVDNFVHNFPHLFSFDPYLNYPSGFLIGPNNLFVYLLGFVTWLIGLGSPNIHMLDTISAYLPAVLGALTVIPVYYIGKTLFDRRTGIVAAGLIAILPGEYMSRTILGSTDRDALEILLTALIMLFLILAIKSAQEERLTLRLINLQYLPILTKPVTYSLLSGVLLGFGLLIWRGIFLLVFIVLVYFIISSILNHLKYKNFDCLSFIGIITFLVALLIFGPLSHSQLYSIVLVISLLLLMILSGLSWLLAQWKIKSYYYPLVLLGIGLLGLAIFYFASPSLFKSMLYQSSTFFPTQTERTITEMKPLLFPAGYFTLFLPWANYTTGFFLSIISLIVLIYLSYKRGKIDHMLFVIWSGIMLIATLDLRRFAAFFAINVALLTGYLTIIIYYAVRFIINYVTSRSNEYVSSQLLGFIGLKAPITYKSSETSTKFDYYEVLGIPRNAIHKQIKKAHRDLVSKYQIGITLTDNDRERLRIIDGAYAVLSDHHKRAIYDRSESNMAMKEKYGTKARKRVGFQAGNGINITVAGLVIFLLVFFPNFNEIPTIINYTTQQQAPNDAWSNSLSWLKDNTPEPFGDAAFYYASYQTPFLYPDTAYSVAAWWDYGYWILRIAHRLPSCDPGGGNRASVANLFTAQSETAANEEANKLNSKYIIIDDATVTTKFYAV